MHDYDNYIYIDNGMIFKLTEKENELLDLFLRNKGKLVTKNDITQRLYFEKYYSGQYVGIYMNIRKLKEKFGLHIVRIHGRGYCLR